MTTIAGFEIHPAAEIFPMMAAAGLRDLAADIKVGGLRELISRWGNDGPVVDGRNRLRACEIAKVTPQFRIIATDSDPIDYVLSLNLHRRQLKTSQKAMVAERVATMRLGDNQHMKEGTSKDVPSVGTSLGQAADALGVSKPTVERARSVRNRAPDLVPAIEAGEMTVGAAMKEIQRRSGSDVIAETSKPWGADHERQKRKKEMVRYKMGMVTARQAVCLLESINKRDRDRDAGLRIVHEWLITQGVCNGE